jgi:hypothetical protein
MSASAVVPGEEPSSSPSFGAASRLLLEGEGYLYLRAGEGSTSLESLLQQVRREVIGFPHSGTLAGHAFLGTGPIPPVSSPTLELGCASSVASSP